MQDRQQLLAAIDTLLSHQLITSLHLTAFTAKHPDVVRQQGIKDDPTDTDVLAGRKLSLSDSEDLFQTVDSVLVSDTSTNTEYHSAVASPTTSYRHLSHRSMSLSLGRIECTRCGYCDR